MTNPTYVRQVRALQAMSDRDFASAVYKWMRNRESTPQDAAPFRDPEIIERTLLAIDTLIDTTEAGIEKISNGRAPDAESKIRFRREMLRTLRTHKRAIRGAAHEEAERRAQLQRGKGPRHRAMVRLSKMYPVEFLALVRDEQAREDALGEDRGPDEEDLGPVEGEKRGPIGAEKRGPVGAEKRGPIDGEDRGPIGREIRGPKGATARTSALPVLATATAAAAAAVFFVPASDAGAEGLRDTPNVVDSRWASGPERGHK